jgi:hypothetical protein
MMSLIDGPTTQTGASAAGLDPLVQIMQSMGAIMNQQINNNGGIGRSSPADNGSASASESTRPPVHVVQFAMPLAASTAVAQEEAVTSPTSAISVLRDDITRAGHLLANAAALPPGSAPMHHAVAQALVQVGLVYQSLAGMQYEHRGIEDSAGDDDDNNNNRSSRSNRSNRSSELSRLIQPLSRQLLPVISMLALGTVQRMEEETETETETETEIPPHVPTPPSPPLSDDPPTPQTEEEEEEEESLLDAILDEMDDMTDMVTETVPSSSASMQQQAFNETTPSSSSHPVLSPLGKRSNPNPNPNESPPALANNWNNGSSMNPSSTSSSSGSLHGSVQRVMAADRRRLESDYAHPIQPPPHYLS